MAVSKNSTTRSANADSDGESAIAIASVVVDRPLGILILYLLDVAHGKRLHGAALLASDQNFDMLLFDFYSV